MKTLRDITAIIASLLLFQIPPAFGLGADYKDYAPRESISHPDNWPPQLIELASLPSRVAGYYINSDDYLAFKGDTAGFQSFLGTCVALSEFAPTTLHIHKGKGSFKPLDKEKKAVSCDWQLDVINQEWRSTKPDPKGPMKRLELHLWLDGAVDLAAIKVPPTVKTIKENNPPAAMSPMLVPDGVTQAAPVPEAWPQNTMLFDERYAAVAVQTEKDVNFVLVHVGSLSRGMQDWVTHERKTTNWGFKGNVYLVDSERTRAAGHNVNKREIAVKYSSSELDTLYLDGKAYALNTSGRIFILRDKGEPVQVPRTLSLRNMDDLVKLGRLAESELLKLDEHVPAELVPKDIKEKSPIRSPEMGPNGTAAEVEAAKLQGAETAAQDIKAGAFRILYLGVPYSNGKPLVDDETGYRVQIVAGCVASSQFVAEADAYNKAMRDWHAKNTPKRN